MKEELNNYDWEQAFAYAGESSGYGSADIQTINNCFRDGFTREDVIKIYNLDVGENDEKPWRIFGKLKDGRYFYLEAGCDYTGWDCQASGRAWVAKSKKEVIQHGMSQEAREIFNLTDSRRAMNIPIKESVVKKVKIDNSIFGLRINEEK